MFSRLRKKPTPSSQDPLRTLTNNSSTDCCKTRTTAKRWGRHWLDQARYADSNGYTIDAPRIMWPYRDWVIDAINRDLPFDQFTIEQVHRKYPQTRPSFNIWPRAFIATRSSTRKGA